MCTVIPRTTVFSIRTEVHGTTMQSNGDQSRNTTDKQFVPTCIPALNYGHVTPIRELPPHTTRVVGVAIPGTSASSWSNIRERDDLSSVVSAIELIGWCQSSCMSFIIDSKGKGLETHHVHQRFQQSLDGTILLTIFIVSQKVLCCFLSYIFGL